MRLGKLPPIVQNRRRHYRRKQGAGHQISIHAATPGGIVAGEFADLSVRGVGARFRARDAESFQEGAVVEIQITSLSHGSVCTPARVVYARNLSGGVVRVGFEFVNMGNLFSQLDAFYARLFNRRRAMRVRPSLDRRIKAEIGLNGQRIEGGITDVSVCGIGVVISLADGYLTQTAERVELSFQVPGKSTTLKGSARVVSRKPASGKVVLGLEFDLEEPQGFAAVQEELEEFVGRRVAEMERWESTWRA